MTTTNVAK